MRSGSEGGSGFDTYKDDPIAGLNIDTADYKKIATCIRDELRYPTLMVQEGGYNVEALADLAESFLSGFIS